MFVYSERRQKKNYTDKKMSARHEKSEDSTGGDERRERARAERDNRATNKKYYRDGIKYGRRRAEREG